jgi:hypothetical protein
MRLDYLSFDYSEDTDGTGTFDAMASVWPEQVAAVHAEIVRVLDWAHGAFPGTRGPVAEGGEWDYDLHGVREFTAPEQLRYDAASRTLTAQAGSPGKPRHTVTLLVSGTDAFCSALRQAFGLA